MRHRHQANRKERRGSQPSVASVTAGLPASFARNITATLLAIAALIYPYSSPRPVESHTIQPYYKEYRMLRGESVDDFFTFQNTEDREVDIEIFVAGYDARDEIIDTDVALLTSSEIISMKVEARQTVKIPYKIQIPQDLNSASYFNVIYARLKQTDNNSPNRVGVQLGLGMIALIHVFDTEEDILKAFINNSTVSMQVERGIPFIRQTKISYLYQNSSEHLFTPYGEAKIFDVDSGRLLKTVSINSGRKHIFPGESYSEEFKVDIWQIDNILSNKKIVARTHSLENPTYIETLLYFEGFPQLTLIAAILLFLIPGVILYARRHFAVRKR